MKNVRFVNIVSTVLLVATAACADDEDKNMSLGEATSPAPLSTVVVPQPVGGDIVDQAAAIRLGKALFWDVQAGGDGLTACASCHFQAGTDSRRTNTIAPGPNGLFQAVAGPGSTWNPASFRFDDIVGSQGVARAAFVSINADPSVAADVCSAQTDTVFADQRRVTGRNTPSAVGAVFFRDNFWDGRASQNFNGKNPFGTTGNNLEGAFTSISNASLASQAVGPPNNDVEMSCAGRGFNGPGSLAAKLLARRPLDKQLVSSTDSVLGALARAPQTGLSVTYQQMIVDAFGPTLAADAENQFSRFWGQAIAAYEATLIPDQTPFDKFLAGNTSAMTKRQRAGWNAFRDPEKANCSGCHAGSELSDATVSFAATKGLINLSGGDQGFHNLGLRPVDEDLGRAGQGPQGVPWSVSGSVFDRGAFKTPGLRNVKLTAPYMHNGMFATLADVVRFYKDGAIFEGPSVSPQFELISVSGGDIDALVDFLTNGLTDCRTEKRRAPFDGPALPLPNGTSLPATGAQGTGSCP